MVAPTAGAGDGQLGWIHFGPLTQIIDGLAIFHHLNPGKGDSRGKKGGPGHFPMIFAKSRPDAPLSGTKSVHTQNDKTGPNTGDTTSLNHRVLLGSSPMAMNMEHGRMLALGLWEIQKPGHPDPLECLKMHFFDPIIFFFNYPDTLGIKRRASDLCHPLLTAPHICKRGSSNCVCKNFFALNGAKKGVALPKSFGLFTDEGQKIVRSLRFGLPGPTEGGYENSTPNDHMGEEWVHGRLSIGKGPVAEGLGQGAWGGGFALVYPNRGQSPL